MMVPRLMLSVDPWQNGVIGRKHVTQNDGDPTFFVPLVRMRVGDGVGQIRSVSDALDWIDHLYADAKGRFSPSASALQRAMQSRSPTDVAEARSMFVEALASADLLKT